MPAPALHFSGRCNVTGLGAVAFLYIIKPSPQSSRAEVCNVASGHSAVGGVQGIQSPTIEPVCLSARPDSGPIAIALSDGTGALNGYNATVAEFRKHWTPLPRSSFIAYSGLFRNFVHKTIYSTACQGRIEKCRTTTRESATLRSPKPLSRRQLLAKRRSRSLKQ